MGLLDFKSSKGRQKPSLVGSIPTRFRHLATNRIAGAEDSDALHCSREDCEAVIDLENLLCTSESLAARHKKRRLFIHVGAGVFRPCI